MIEGWTLAEWDFGLKPMANWVFEVIDNRWTHIWGLGYGKTVGRVVEGSTVQNTFPRVIDWSINLNLYVVCNVHLVRVVLIGVLDKF